MRSVVTAVAVFLPVGAGLNNLSAHQFSLNSHKDFFRNNSFMIVFYIVLLNRTVILSSDFVKKVYGTGFLK